ncbi:MAG: amidohydrolase, partial [Gammaproteobacteria bacterium]|nr:amidohydrolase [Gammaproteobacteria bacterium]
MSKTTVFSMVSLLPVALAISSSIAQDNLTPNGIVDIRQDAYALTNGNIYQPNGQILANANLMIRDGRIVEINSSNSVPDGFFTIDLQGKYVYPGLVDIYTQYGIPDLAVAEDQNGRAENLFSDDQALNVNSAIRSHFRASTAFAPSEEDRGELRELGFSTVLSFRADGIARGTSALITLGDDSANKSVIVPDVAAHYSLSKGSSVQTMPSSMMGAIALLRQTY